MTAVCEDALDLSARISPSSPHPPPPPPPPHPPTLSSSPPRPSYSSWNKLLHHRKNRSVLNYANTNDVTSFGVRKSTEKANIDVTMLNKTDGKETDRDVTLFRANLKEDISDDVMSLNKIRNKETERDVRVRKETYDDDEDDNEINEKRAKIKMDEDNDNNIDDNDVITRKRQNYDVTDYDVRTFSRQRSDDDAECDVKPFRRKQRNDSERYYDDGDDDDDDDHSESSSSTRPSRIHSLPPPLPAAASLTHNSKVRAARRSEQSSPRSHFNSSYPNPYLSVKTTPPLPFLPSLNPLNPSLNPQHASALNPLLSMQLFSRLQAQVESANRARNGYERFGGTFSPGFGTGGVGGVPRHLATTGGSSDIPQSYRPSYPDNSKSPQDQHHHTQTGQKRLRQQYSPGEPLSSQSSKTTSGSPSMSRGDGGGDSKQMKLYLESSEVKNSDYFERRRKNNEAAKRSRDSRRMKEEGTASRAAFLEQENIQLKAELQMWRTESAKLHRLIYDRL